MQTYVSQLRQVSNNFDRQQSGNNKERGLGADFQRPQAKDAHEERLCWEKYLNRRRSSPSGAKETSPVRASPPCLKHGGLAKGWVTNERFPHLAAAEPALSEAEWARSTAPAKRHEK